MEIEGESSEWSKGMLNVWGEVGGWEMEGEIQRTEHDIEERGGFIVVQYHEKDCSWNNQKI